MPDPELDGGAPQSEALADLVVAAGVLALIVTVIVMFVGPRLGGPVPTFKLWTTLGPLLLLPLAILVGLLLAPGGVIRGRTAGWLLRIALGLGGAGAFAAVLLVLNLPTLLASH